MPETKLWGQNLFGTQRHQVDPSKYSPWRYVLIAAVVVLASIYAAPNIYRPDFAIDIEADASSVQIGSNFAEQVGGFLADEGISVKGWDVVGRVATIRLNSDTDQLVAKAALEQRLNPAGRDRQFVIALNLAPTTPQWLVDLKASPMTLGLDLAGGIHFVLQVDMATALDKQMADEADKLTDELRDAGARYLPEGDFVDGDSVLVSFGSIELRDSAMAILEEVYGPPDYILEIDDTLEYPALRLFISDSRLEEIEDVAIEQNLSGLRGRVNELGVAEPLVQRLGASRIVIDLPGIQDSAKAKRILDKFATLEFRLVAKTADRPSEIEVMPYEGRVVSIQRANIITGDSVIHAIQQRDPETSLPEVLVSLDSTGGERMHRATAPNVGHSMAVIFIEQKPVTATRLEGGKPTEYVRIEEERRLISVATIQAALGYKFRITGLDLREAQELAILLRAGALAAPMYFVEERTVGASLGAENIELGMYAVVLGFGLVLVFMCFYYKVFGVIANIALTLNLVILVAVMSVMGATLTLPGIAGIVLTVGMAVDANVLIFSRIREELTRSAPLIAIQAGYDRAILTILDANITTLFVALILFAIGSGPVAGFAVTLSVGIITSMFTAIFMSRGLVHLVYGRHTVKRLWI